MTLRFGSRACASVSKGWKQIFKKDFIYLFMREREREAKTQAEGKAGSMQGALYGIRSQVSRIAPRAEGDAKPLSHPGPPSI